MIPRAWSSLPSLFVHLEVRPGREDGPPRENGVGYLKLKHRCRKGSPFARGGPEIFLKIFLKILPKIFVLPKSSAAGPLGGGRFGFLSLPLFASLSDRRSPLLLWILSIGGAILSFPPFEWPLAWPLMCFALLRASEVLPPRHGWLWGLCWGCGFWLSGLRWLYQGLTDAGGLSPLSALGFVILVTVLLGPLSALPFWISTATGAAICRWRQRHRTQPTWEVASWSGTPWLLVALLALHEALLNRMPFGGIPWRSLASPLTETPFALALAPLVASPGVVLCAGWVVLCGKAAPLLPGVWRRGYHLLWLTGCIVLFFPFARFDAAPSRLPERTSERVLLVARDEAEPASPAEDLRAYLALTLTARDGRPARFAAAPADVVRAAPAKAPADAAPADVTSSPTTDAIPGDAVPGDAANPTPLLVLWPETAIRGGVERGRLLVSLSELASLEAIGWLLGASFLDGQGRFYNAFYLVPPGPFDFVRGAKRWLVPFGEYVPRGWGWLFPNKLSGGGRDFAPGRWPNVIDWQGHRVGVALCFESTLPQAMRSLVAGGAEAVAVLAHQRWLNAAAARQHRLLSALRGLEVGRDVWFVASAGESAWLQRGRTLRRTRHAPLWIDAHWQKTQTPYVRWGLWPFFGLLVFYGVLVAGHARIRRRKRTRV